MNKGIIPSMVTYQLKTLLAIQPEYPLELIKFLGVINKIMKQAQQNNTPGHAPLVKEVKANGGIISSIITYQIHSLSP